MGRGNRFRTLSDVVVDLYRFTPQCRKDKQTLAGVATPIIVTGINFCCIRTDLQLHLPASKLNSLVLHEYLRMNWYGHVSTTSSFCGSTMEIPRFDIRNSHRPLNFNLEPGQKKTVKRSTEPSQIGVLKIMEWAQSHQYLNDLKGLSQPNRTFSH